MRTDVFSGKHSDTTGVEVLETREVIDFRVDDNPLSKRDPSTRLFHSCNASTYQVIRLVVLDKTVSKLSFTGSSLLSYLFNLFASERLELCGCH